MKNNLPPLSSFYVVPKFSVLPPLALYVHLPWCLKKCPYCDFNSHEWAIGNLPEERYLSALEADLNAAIALVQNRTVHTVFIGGGTPSLFSSKSIGRLLDLISNKLLLSSDVEITLEANPGTFEFQRFADFSAAGVNRLSIGVQTFSESGLKALGRVHDSRQSVAAIKEASQHFQEINIDIMYGWPGQKLSDLEFDLRQVLSYGVTHLSLYHFTLEPNTWFARYPPVLPDEGTLVEMQSILETSMIKAGFKQYEVSAWSVSEMSRCRHNVNYWEFGDYLGIGAGAHSKISFLDRVVRQARFKHPEIYMNKSLDRCSEVSSMGMNFLKYTGEYSNVELNHIVPYQELSFEFFLNTFRLVDGVPVSFFSERTGLDISLVSDRLLEAKKKGFLEDDPLRFCASPLGFRFLNDLQVMFLSN